MARKLARTDPAWFNLKTFAEMLPPREPMVGEAPGSFEGFQQGLLASLAPATPYECIIAENLIAIEWELMQLRRMRDAALRRLMTEAIITAYVKAAETECQTEIDRMYGEFLEAGGDEDDWEAPVDFDEAEAEEEGGKLALQAVSENADVRTAALDEIRALGMDAMEIMAETYAKGTGTAVKLYDRMKELEVRRREVKRDFDALVRARPVEADLIDRDAEDDKRA